jgi:hypothetical protein
MNEFVAAKLGYMPGSVIGIGAETRIRDIFTDSVRFL